MKGKKKILQLLKIQVTIKNSSYSSKKEKSIHLLSNPSDPSHFSFVTESDDLHSAGTPLFPMPRTHSGCRAAEGVEGEDGEWGLAARVDLTTEL